MKKTIQERARKAQATIKSGRLGVAPTPIIAMLRTTTTRRQFAERQEHAAACSAAGGLATFRGMAREAANARPEDVIEALANVAAAKRQAMTRYRKHLEAIECLEAALANEERKP